MSSTGASTDPPPFGFLVHPEKLALKQLPPHPEFSALPEPQQPLGQTYMYQKQPVPSVDGAIDQAGQAHTENSSTPLPSQGDSRRNDQPSANHGSSTGLALFIQSVLDQGRSFAAGLTTEPDSAEHERLGVGDPTAQGAPWKKIDTKDHHPNKIEIFRRDLQRSGREADSGSTSTDAASATAETWFARRSYHADNITEGNATLREFKNGIVMNHSEHEQDYTPDLIDAHLVLAYSLPRDLVVNGYTDIEMRVFEMCHKLPPPLKRRVFPVLVIAAQVSESCFIVVQIPVSDNDMALLPTSSYCGKSKGVVVGTYASVEYIYTDKNDSIQWIMATSSDAAGVLPQWMQKKALPGAIAKDVPLFLEWAKKVRPEGGAAQSAEQGKPKGFSTLRLSKHLARSVRKRFISGPEVFEGLADKHIAPSHEERPVDLSSQS